MDEEGWGELSGLQRSMRTFKKFLVDIGTRLHLVEMAENATKLRLVAIENRLGPDLCHVPILDEIQMRIRDHGAMVAGNAQFELEQWAKRLTGLLDSHVQRIGQLEQAMSSQAGLITELQEEIRLLKSQVRELAKLHLADDEGWECYLNYDAWVKRLKGQRKGVEGEDHKENTAALVGEMA